jgi:uncharacterized protein YjbI with pentapeptide repeats
MKNIVVNFAEYFQIQEKLANTLPNGISFSAQSFNAKNYGEGLFLVVHFDKEVRDRETQRPHYRDTKSLHEGLKTEFGFRDSEIEMLDFVDKFLPDYGNGSRIEEAEFILTTWPLDNESDDLPVLQLKVEGKLIAQCPLITEGEGYQSNMAVLQGFAGAKSLITAQKCVLFGVSKEVRWLIPARIDLSKANLSHVSFAREDLSKCDFSGANLRGANLSGADLFGANLSGANLSGANLSYANLSKANLSGADLQNARLEGTKVISADLTKADLQKAVLLNTDFEGADLSGANLRDAKFWGPNLIKVNLTGAHIYGTHLPFEKMGGATMPDGTIHH